MQLVIFWQGAVGATESCLSGYTKLGSSCYKFYSSQKNWATAHSTCVQDGGDLASINDASELNTLRTFLSG